MKILLEFIFHITLMLKLLTTHKLFFFTYTSNFSQREQACSKSSGEINSVIKRRYISTFAFQILWLIIKKVKRILTWKENNIFNFIKTVPVPLARLKRQYISIRLIMPPAFSSGIPTKSANYLSKEKFLSKNKSIGNWMLIKKKYHQV